MNPERLKVLFITHNFPDGSAGPNPHSLVLLADALAYHGVSVRVVAPQANTSESATADERVDRFRVATPRPTAVRAAAVDSGFSSHTPTERPRSARSTTLNYLGAGFGTAVKARRDFEPDLVHAHWWFPSGLVGSWLSSLSSLPLVTSLHGFDPGVGDVGSRARPLFRHVVQRSSAVTVESRAEARRLAEVLHGVQPVVAPLPLSVEAFEQRGVRENLAVVVSAAGSGPEGESLAELLRSLEASGMHIAVVADRETEAGLSAIMESSGVARSATLVRTSDSISLQGALAGARACVVHSAGLRQRPTLLAAMLSGTPLVMLDAAPFSDLLPQHSPVATAAAAGTTPERVRQLLSLVSNEAGMREQGSAARMHAMATLAPDSCAAQMLGVYLRAIGDAAS